MSTPQTDLPSPHIVQPTNETDQPTLKKPLRLWPGVITVVLLWACWWVVPRLTPAALFPGIIGAFVCVLALLVWWLFFSRAAWLERLGALALMIVAVILTKRIVHPSIAGGMMGMMMPVFVIPVLSLALVIWAATTRRLSSNVRRALLVVAIVIGCGVFTLIRTGGISGDAYSDIHWRWTKTPEEQLLAKGDVVITAPSQPAPVTGGDWSGFRGPERNSVVRGTHLKTDWTASPPVELWRRQIGPGWSSFSVSGSHVYTQEQRGKDEIVACYDMSTGNPVWKHSDAARFWESNAGPGPRGTPTLSNGRVYTLGATGILNVLDAGSGKVIWSRDAAADTGAKVPMWGFASSPLIVDDLVVVATAGELAAYDLASGKPRWFGPDGGSGYSSPHLFTLDGVPQILLLRGPGVTSVAPSDGKVLWEHAWPGVPIVQPALTADGDVLVSVSESSGTRRLAVDQGTAGWTVQERWTSEGLNPYFNDFVIHDGHAYGFDWSSLSCIDLKDGSQRWKGGRYGHGQLVLLPDQNVLLVLSEAGEVALVKASTEGFTELARFKAIEGKTWNHPVLVNDIVLVRNDQEMAAFRLPLAGG